jgi:hypothetical protein
MFVYLRQLGGDLTLMGVCLFVTCLIEVPVFYFGSRLIKKAGVLGCFTIIAIAYSIRFFAYSSMHKFTSLWYILPVQGLHGITFGLLYNVGIQYSQMVAPVGHESSMQGCFSGAFGGLGVAIGALGGGSLIRPLHGIGHLFVFMGSCAVTLSAGLTLLSLWLKYNKKGHDAATMNNVDQQQVQYTVIVTNENNENEEEDGIIVCNKA